MKRLVTVLIIFITLIGLSGCGSPKGWSEKDFVFYDQDGKVLLEPTAKQYYLKLKDTAPNTNTYRKVKIGDNANDALKKYDLTDFSYQIRPTDILSLVDTSKIIKNFEEKAPTFKELIPYFSDIVKNDLYVIAACYIYKQDGKLCTKSSLKNYGIDKDHKLKYTIMFTIVDEKISNVYIANNYYYWLPSITDDSKYDWVRELGK